MDNANAIQAASDAQAVPAGPFQVSLEAPAMAFPCRDGESVLAAVHRLGQRGIPVGCRSGGCGVCKVAVLSGSYSAVAMSRDHVSESEEAAGQVLACRIYPRSDLHLQVIGKMLAPLGKAAAALDAATAR
jgi:ferredoxin